MEIQKILKRKKFTLFVKRCFDICASLFGIILFLPFYILISLLIKLTSKGPVLFKQIRVGKNGKKFKICKFRTMIVDAEKKGLQITVGEDKRITKIGKILRKTKVDEMPQLFNVFLGQMSFVGPRPEVPKYVEQYNNEQNQILLIKPGITELSSIIYRNESEELAKSSEPDKLYVEEIMPKKININLKYIKKMSLFYDIKLIFKTFWVVIFK